MEGERETRKVPSYSDHGGLDFDEVPRMAAVAKSANAALPSLKRPTEGVERVEKGVVVLLLGGIRSRRDDDDARARGGPRQQWRLGASPWLGEGEREGKGASEGECWLRGALEDIAT
jgi:hypothetical protein